MVPNRLARIVLLCMDNDSAGTIKHGKVVSDAIEKLEKAGKEDFLNGIGKRELEQLMRGFEQGKVSPNPALAGKIKEMQLVR